MTVIRSRDWRSNVGQKPPVGAEIDWSHQLARGLVNCFLMNEGMGLRTVDLAGGLVGTLTSSPTWSGYNTTKSNTASDQWNQCINFPGGGSAYVDAPQPNDSLYTGDISLIWRGVIRDVSTYRHFMGKHTGNGATNCPFDFRTNGSTQMYLVRTSAAQNGSYRSDDNTFGANAWQNFSVSAYADLSQVCQFYITGRPTNSTVANVGSGNATGSGANIRIGRRADGAVQMDGICAYALIYNRILTADEHLWLQEEPYSMFLLTNQHRTYKGTPAGPGAGRSFAVIIG